MELRQTGLHHHPKGFHEGMVIPPLLYLHLMLQCQGIVSIGLLKSTGHVSVAHLVLFDGLGGLGIIKACHEFHI